MFNFRRLISSVVALSMTAVLFAGVASAAIPSDVAGTKYEEAAEVLGALEIMVGDAETGNFRPDDAIIRSEVTKVGVAVMGLLSVAENSAHATKYPDVVSNHWANGFINVATDQGMVEGDDVGTFRPDQQIKYSEAVAILVRALGYEPQAEAKGGYPSGYLVTASNIGLTKGVSATADQLISRGAVAQMTFNALTINLMEQTGFGSDINYEVVDKTLLKDYLDVTLVEGVVTAVGSSSIDGESSLEKDEIRIGDKNYKIGDADVRTVLGFYVDAYIFEDDRTGNETLLLARPVDGKNNVLKVTSDNIDSVENTESSKILNYWKDKEEDKKTSKANISTEAKVMYNGKSGTFEDFKVIDSGNIALLDTDGNGVYDIVFVNETQNYVVEEVIESTYKIVDKYGLKTLILDPEDDDLTFTLIHGSQEIEIGDLEEWDVITVTVSKDEEFIYGEVSTDSVTGTVTETDDEKVFINGEGYKVAANYPGTIKLEDEGTFYLDAEKKIAAVDGESTVSSNYAYVADIGISSGLDKVLDFKLFTKDGETLVISSGAKIKVNDTNNLTPEQALEAIKGSRDSAKGQLITFEKNSDGKIYRVNTYTAQSAIDEDKFTLNMQEEGVVYKSVSSKLVGKTMSVNITDETVIFDIPASSTDTDDYSIRNKSFFVNDDEYDVLVFNVTEDYNAKAVIVTNSTGQANEEDAIAVVDKITTTKNEDGINVEKLYAYQNGEAITLMTSEDDILVKDKEAEKVALQQGDIIQYKTNAAGEIDGITVLFDISLKDTEKTVVHSDNMSTFYGKVTKKFSSSFNLQVNDGAVENFSIGDAAIYVVDTTKSAKQVRVGDAGDIQKYDDAAPERVFVRVYKDVVQEIVVIK
ncbi:MAG: S-layer homology domain-containing protein [Clostridia bacterium]|nr:S-layer homology domain-containing protein [Clostridia bacterium]